MAPVHIDYRRLMLRDLVEADRAAFVRYQIDPRYLRLYDLVEGDEARAEELFDRFLSWQQEDPRRNIQLGIFERATHRLLGSAGLRRIDGQSALFGIELAPDAWGRFRVALDAAAALLRYGFETMQLHTIMGETASGNIRTAKLARWFGAKIVDQRSGPEWMQARGWQETVWALDRDTGLARLNRGPNPRQLPR